MLPRSQRGDRRLVRCFCARYSVVIRLCRRSFGRRCSLLRSRIPRPPRTLYRGNGAGHRFSERGFSGYEFFRSRLLRCRLPSGRRLRHRFAVAFDQSTTATGPSLHQRSAMGRRRAFWRI